MYYPQLFKQSRPYLKSLVPQLVVAAARRALRPNSAFSLAADEIRKVMPPEYLQQSSPKFDARRFTCEIQAALCYGEWIIQGSVLYDFSPALTTDLSSSELKDITLDALQFPFVAGYLHFGPQENLTLQSGAQVSGAYLIYSQEHSLRVVLTAELPNNTVWTERYQEQYDLRISSEHFDKGIERAIEAALVDDVRDLQEARKLIEADPKLAGISKNAVSQYIETHEANFDTYGSAVELIVKGLCYVSTYPGDIREAWPDKAPERLTTQAEKGGPKEATRAKSKLHAMGYGKVLRVGENFTGALVE